RFTFVRVRYETGPGGYWYRGLPAWAHGYPMAEQNLMRIMNEVSFLGAQDRQPRLATVRGQHEARVARRALLRDAGLAPDLPHLLRDQQPRYRAAGLQRRPPDLPRRVRGQRPVEAVDDDRQLQHRHLTVLGVVGHRSAADRRHQRSLQA